MLKYQDTENVYSLCTKTEDQLLHYLASNLKDNSVAVEIGSFVGASSCYIADGLLNSSNSILYCVDVWEKNYGGYGPFDKHLLQIGDFYQEFEKNTKNYSNIIKPIKSYSIDAFPIIKKEVKKIDLLFIDSNHLYENTKNEWQLYSTLMVKGSIIVMHDYEIPDVRRVIDEEIISHCDKYYTNIPNMFWGIIK